MLVLRPRLRRRKGCALLAYGRLTYRRHLIGSWEGGRGTMSKSRYIVATSMAGTHLAIRYTEEPSGQIEEGEVLAEFRDEKTARDFCQTWYGDFGKQTS